jgi:hypothetical protein
MKHTVPDALLSRQLLCFVRDSQPTVEEFIARFGGPGGQAFHVLRKHGITAVEGGRVRLNRRHLSPDGKRFAWRNRVIHLDEDIVDIVRQASRRMVMPSDECQR